MSAPEYIALRVGLAGHPVIDEVVSISGCDRPLVLAVLIEVIEAGLGHTDRGSLLNFNVDDTADRLGAGRSEIFSIFDAFRCVGLVAARLGPGYADLHRHPVRYEGGEE